MESWQQAHLDDIANHVARDLLIMDTIPITTIRQALWKPAKKVARNATKGPQAELYGVGFGAVVLTWEYLPRIHNIIGGAAEDVGPTVVSAVLAQRGISPPYGDVLTIIELTIGVFSKSPMRQTKSAWELSKRISARWPPAFDAKIGIMCFSAWTDVAVHVKNQNEFGYESHIRLAELQAAKQEPPS